MTKVVLWFITSFLALVSFLAFALVVSYFLADGLFMVTQVSAALAPDSTYPFVQNSVADPGILTILSPSGTMGSGYLTSDGYIYTAYHVVDRGISRINLFGRNLNWGEGQCDVLNGDGPCVIQSRGAIAPIIRYPQVNLWQEVAIYHTQYHAWMFYQIVLPGDTDSYLVGLGMDMDGDGVADFDSFVCSGMSGSPVFLSQNGVPYLYQGNYVSVGELIAVVHPWQQDERTKCSQNLIMVH